MRTLGWLQAESNRLHARLNRLTSKLAEAQKELDSRHNSSGTEPMHTLIVFPFYITEQPKANLNILTLITTLTHPSNSH